MRTDALFWLGTVNGTSVETGCLYNIQNAYFSPYGPGRIPHAWSSSSGKLLCNLIADKYMISIQKGVTISNLCEEKERKRGTRGGFLAIQDQESGPLQKNAHI